MLARAMTENVNVQMLMKHYVLLQCSEMARRLPEPERLRQVEELVYKFFCGLKIVGGEIEIGC